MANEFTREQFVRSLRAKCRYLEGDGAAHLADAIKINGLEPVIAGRHNGKPITFAAAYAVVFGEKLK